MFTVVMHALLLALGLILPLGVQNVFVFNQGANQRTFKQALPVVVTASVCDTILIVVAVLGVSAVAASFSFFQTLIFGIGLLFLAYMGFVTWKSEPSKTSVKEGMTVKAQILFAASVSLLNPHALMDIMGVIGTNSLLYSGKEKWVFTLVTISVSWIWFLSLAFAGKAVGKMDSNGKIMIWVNKASACMIWGVALYMAKSMFFQ
ncbi:MULTISPECIES: LysE/ArgO family amino acid transporter [Priestia]|uniref:LysE/ArgO family amino acid transporter n=1 Tax=Priestia TaxID=2800373 RepID=UPI00040A15B6|nr:MULTISPECIES: LysE family transporter [Priestia]MBK0006611.1 LysE family transporter [Bacillus sp. S35]MCM3641175.1 LysE family transporter [Priestia aryabhattai]PFW79355.1 lysine transporter LysE [Priestia aryabhattai]